MRRPKPVVPPPALKRPAPVTSLPTLRTLGPVEIIYDVEQGSDEWFDLRLGIPTASNFKTIMATGKDDPESKTRARLMRMLAGEILTGQPAEGKIVTAAMQRGKDMEADAREHYLATHFGDLDQVGFIRRKLPSGRYVGASPDGLIGTVKALEIKTMAPDLMIERLLAGAGMPPEHRAQVHGTMMVGDLDEVDLLLFYRGMPIAPKFTIRRDNAYIAEIQRAVEVFDFEVNALVERIRKMAR